MGGGGARGVVVGATATCGSTTLASCDRVIRIARHVYDPYGTKNHVLRRTRTRASAPDGRTGGPSASGAASRSISSHRSPRASSARGASVEPRRASSDQRPRTRAARTRAARRAGAGRAAATRARSTSRERRRARARGGGGGGGLGDARVPRARRGRARARAARRPARGVGARASAASAPRARREARGRLHLGEGGERDGEEPAARGARARPDAATEPADRRTPLDPTLARSPRVDPIAARFAGRRRPRAHRRAPCAQLRHRGCQDHGLGGGGAGETGGRTRSRSRASESEQRIAEVQRQRREAQEAARRGEQDLPDLAPRRPGLRVLSLFHDL